MISGKLFCLVWNMLQQCGPHIQQQILQNLKLYSAGQPAGLPVTDYQHISSVSQMRKDLNWRTLEQRRIDSRLTLMYKITYNLEAIPAAGYLIPNTRQSRHNHQLAYRQIPTLKGWSESSLVAQSFCWSCHVAAYMFNWAVSWDNGTFTSVNTFFKRACTAIQWG